MPSKTAGQHLPVDTEQ